MNEKAKLQPYLSRQTPVNGGLRPNLCHKIGLCIARLKGQYQYQYQYLEAAKVQYQYQYQYLKVADGQYQYQYQYLENRDFNTNTNTNTSPNTNTSIPIPGIAGLWYLLHDTKLVSKANLQVSNLTNDAVFWLIYSYLIEWASICKSYVVKSIESIGIGIEVLVFGPVLVLVLVLTSSQMRVLVLVLVLASSHGPVLVLVLALSQSPVLVLVLVLTSAKFWYWYWYWGTKIGIAGVCYEVDLTTKLFSKPFPKLCQYDTL